MSIGKFNILDVAKIQISANGKTQTVEFVGPTPLKGFKNENNKKTDQGREYKERAREVSRRERFSEGVGPE